MIAFFLLRFMISLTTPAFSTVVKEKELPLCILYCCNTGVSFFCISLLILIYKTAKNFFQKIRNFKTCDPVHISNINVLGLMTKPVELYADPSLKFCLPVFTNFPSCPVSISNFVTAC